MVTMHFDDIVLLLVLYSFHYEIYPFTILFEFTFQAEDLQREKEYLKQQLKIDGLVELLTDNSWHVMLLLGQPVVEVLLLHR